MHIAFIKCTYMQKSNKYSSALLRNVTICKINILQVTTYHKENV